MSTRKKSLVRSVIKWVIVAFAVFGIAFSVFLAVLLGLVSYSYQHWGGSPTFLAYSKYIQEDLKPLIKWVGTGSYWRNHTRYELGVLQWIGKSDWPVTSMQNIHLKMYATGKNATHPYTEEIHYAMYTGNFTLPENLLWSSETVTVPLIGVDYPCSPEFKLSIKYDP